MLEKKITDETKNLIVIIASILSVPFLFYLLNRFEGGGAEDADQGKKQKTIMVSEADKNTASAKLPPAKVANIHDALARGSYSTAHLQLRKVARDSPEYKELLKTIVESNLEKGKVKTVGATAKTPLRYVDESSPRDRHSDAVYLYAVDLSGTPDLWFCI